MDVGHPYEIENRGDKSLLYLPRYEWIDINRMSACIPCAMYMGLVSEEAIMPKLHMHIDKPIKILLPGMFFQQHENRSQKFHILLANLVLTER